MNDTSQENPKESTKEYKNTQCNPDLDSTQNFKSCFSISMQYDPMNSSLDNLSDNSDDNYNKSLRQYSSEKNLERIPEIFESYCNTSNDLNQKVLQENKSEISEKSNLNNLDIPQMTFEFSNQDNPYSNPVTFEQTPQETPNPDDELINRSNYIPQKNVKNNASNSTFSDNVFELKSEIITNEHSKREINFHVGQDPARSLKFTRNNSGLIKESVLLRQSSFSEKNTVFNNIMNENTFLSTKTLDQLKPENISEKPSAQEITPMKEIESKLCNQTKVVEIKSQHITEDEFLTCKDDTATCFYTCPLSAKSISNQSQNSGKHILKNLEKNFNDEDLNNLFSEMFNNNDIKNINDSEKYNSFAKKNGKNYDTCPDLMAEIYFENDPKDISEILYNKIDFNNDLEKKRSEKVIKQNTEESNIYFETCHDYNKENIGTSQQYNTNPVGKKLVLDQQDESYINLSVQKPSTFIIPSTNNTLFKQKAPNVIKVDKNFDTTLDRNIIEQNKVQTTHQKGKEYFENGSLKYEGYYLAMDGLFSKEGQGTLFYESGNMKFKGVFSKNQYNEKGIEYYEEGGVRYIGYYNKGKKDGHGIEYYESGSIKYKGFFDQNKYNGFGVQFFESGNKKLECEFVNGVAFSSGEKGGVAYFENSGSILYKGEILNGMRNNKGTEYYENGVLKYFGTYSKDKKHGEGKLFNMNGVLVYKGELQDDLKHGFGMAYDQVSGHKIYEGQQSKDKRNGFGIMYYPNGNKTYEGQWLDEKFEGNGIIFDKISGKKIKSGNFINGIINGQGKEYDEKGNVKFVGKFELGIKTGFGAEYKVISDKSKNKSKLVKTYEGYFIEGKKHGKGIKYNDEGLKIYEGELVNEKFHGKGIQYDVIRNDSEHLTIENYEKLTSKPGKVVKVYEGYFKENFREGPGKSYHKNLENNMEYEGYWLKNLFHGAGTKFYSNGFKEYEGYFTAGMTCKQGVKFYTTGSFKYDGYTHNNEREKTGIYYYENGFKLYDGSWRSDKRHGFGKAYYSSVRNAIMYEGNWAEDFADGFGVKRFENGCIYYKGTWKKGKKQGYAKECFHLENCKDKQGKDVVSIKYNGEFVNGQKIGWGTVWHQNGKQKRIIHNENNDKILRFVTIPLYDSYGNISYTTQ